MPRVGAGHVYDWFKARGFWIRGHGQGVSEEPDQRKPTHLLLDGGKACVPAEAHEEFVNVYAASLVRFPFRRPCVVELRTPVFRFFVDLDTRFSCEEDASALAEDRDDSLHTLLDLLTSALPHALPAVACVSSAPKISRGEDGTTTKRGLHVVWPEALVTARTALELRRRMLEALTSAEWRPRGLVGSWDAILDASVFRSNGLRMAWSAKGRGDASFYEPRYEYAPGVPPGESSSSTLAPAAKIEGVSALRAALGRLAIRVPTATTPTVLVDGEAAVDDDDDDENGHGVTAASLARFSSVLPALAAALPVEFKNQQFAGVVAGEHCYMLRSTSRFCFNLGRTHRTTNVYFVLTRRGVSQRCYCRCETTEGRKYGLCKDFVSDCWSVPKAVLHAFFPDDADAVDQSRQRSSPAQPQPQQQQAARVGAMPSRSRKICLDALIANSCAGGGAVGGGQKKKRSKQA